MLQLPLNRSRICTLHLNVTMLQNWILFSRYLQKHATPHGRLNPATRPPLCPHKRLQTDSQERQLQFSTCICDARKGEMRRSTRHRSIIYQRNVHHGSKHAILHSVCYIRLLRCCHESFVVLLGLLTTRMIDTTLPSSADYSRWYALKASQSVQLEYNKGSTCGANVIAAHLLYDLSDMLSESAFAGCLQCMCARRYRHPDIPGRTI